MSRVAIAFKWEVLSPTKKGFCAYKVLLFRLQYGQTYVNKYNHSIVEATASWEIGWKETLRIQNIYKTLNRFYLNN